MAGDDLLVGILSCSELGMITVLLGQVTLSE